MRPVEKAKIGVAVVLLIVMAALWVYRLPQVQTIQENLRQASGHVEVVFERDGVTYLRGGRHDWEHFDIGEFDLNPDQLHYGIGRENFPALIHPEFVSAEEANVWLPDEERVLAVKIGEEAKVYPIPLLIGHEVVNDVVGGHPIFAAYCILADLGAVYDRTINGRVFTFALSGYTYYDPDVWDSRDAFVMWDRETESLWWPPVGKGVSGIMRGAQLRVLNTNIWSQTTWGEVRALYPEAVVLQQGQDLQPPVEWPQYDDPGDPDASQGDLTLAAIAPRWGDNKDIAGSQSSR